MKRLSSVTSQTRLPAAPIEIVVAVGLPKSFPLPVIVIEVVTELTDRAVDRCVIPIILVAAEHVLGREMKRRVTARHLRDEIDRAARLGTRTAKPRRRE